MIKLRKLKLQKGITMVALIITVVIILILSTTLILTLKNNDIIFNSKKVTSESNNKQVEEQLLVALDKWKTVYSFNKNVTFGEFLQNELKKNNYELIPLREGKSYLIIVENVQYKVNEDGSVGDRVAIGKAEIENVGDLSKGGQYDGTTEETAYRITCIEDLVEWTNNYNKYASKYIALENTIDFENVLDYNNYKAKTTDINKNGEIEPLITELTAGTGFKPIASFAGTFDGQGNEIRNIYENTTDSAGLFASSGTAKIKNLGITGEITTTGNAGGISGTGSSVTLENCYNKCKIITSGTIAGGLIGNGGTNSKNKIYNCYNLGHVESTNFTGGLVGYNHGDASSYFIYNSFNQGEVRSDGYSGGIIGRSNGTLKYIINCCNFGKIYGSYPGGLVGYDYYAIPYIRNCFNAGTVEVKSGSMAGGICYVTRGTNGRDPDNVFFLDTVERALASPNYLSYNANPLTQGYMQSQDFVKDLNDYVDNYTPGEGEENVPLLKWKYNKGNYPTFDDT